jgi:chromosome segregation ATPase
MNWSEILVVAIPVLFGGTGIYGILQIRSRNRLNHAVAQGKENLNQLQGADQLGKLWQEYASKIKSDMEDREAEYDKEIGQLRSDVKELRDSLRAKAIQEDYLNAQVMQITRKVESITQERDDLRDENRVLTRQNKEMTKRIGHLEAQVKVLQEHDTEYDGV